MKELLLFFLFTFAFVSCKNSPNTTIAVNNQNSNEIKKEGNYSHVTKAKELELSQQNTYQIGRKEAEDDISQGRLILKTTGDPVKTVFERGKILNEKYEIQMFHFGCCFSEKIDKYVKGYNEVSENEIKKRFGKYVLDDTWKEAKKKINNE